MLIQIMLIRLYLIFIVTLKLYSCTSVTSWTEKSYDETNVKGMFNERKAIFQ